MRVWVAWLAAGALIAGCTTQRAVSDDDDGSSSVGVGGGSSGSGGSGGEDQPQTFIDILGWGQHTADSVEMTTVATAANGLNVPRDLAFNPAVPGQLWIVNRADESMVILHGAGTPEQTSQKFEDDFTGIHFLARPVGLAFGDNGNLATIHETDQLTQGNETPPDFMGPTLWPSDLNIFTAGHEGHIDMLHNSPLGMGIAWYQGNSYWVFDGYHSSITLYDFRVDHGPGGTDHTDGVIRRYVEGEVKRQPEVSSHMEYEAATGLLYIADTGNNRIAVLDTNTGTEGGGFGPDYDGADMRRVDGGVITTFSDGQETGNMWPSGVAFYGDYLLVSDFYSGVIYGYDRATGELLDWLETGTQENSLMGLEVDAQGQLYAVDSANDSIFRITVKPQPAEG